MSLTRKGRKFSNEHRRKLSLALIGKIRSLETRAKLTIARTNISEETRMKLKLGQQRRRRQEKSIQT